MARIIEGPSPFKMGKSGKAKYPWDEWLNGEVWELTRAEDFPSVDCFALASTAYQAAVRYGGKVRVHFIDGRTGDRIVIQFYKPEPVTE